MQRTYEVERSAVFGEMRLYIYVIEMTYLKFCSCHRFPYMNLYYWCICTIKIHIFIQLSYICMCYSSPFQIRYRWQLCSKFKPSRIFITKSWIIFAEKIYLYNLRTVDAINPLLCSFKNNVESNIWQKSLQKNLTAKRPLCWPMITWY